MTKTQFSISEASRITGKSRTTLRSYLKKGTLSSTEGHNGQRFLEASELLRVFGDDLDFERAAPEGAPSVAPSKTRRDGQPDQAKAKTLQQQLDREIAERERERERHEKQLDDLHGVLKRAQEGHTKAMLLLENRSEGRGEWEKPLKALQQQVAIQQKEQQELRESAKRRIATLQQQLKQERSKSWFDRLFDRGGRG